MTTTQKTYSSLLTPAGSGAIAVIRVTGADARRIVSQLFEPASQAFQLNNTNDKLFYGWIAQSGERIDDVIISTEPHSSPLFVDISTHAGIRIVERVLAALAAAGAPFLALSLTQAWPANSLIEQEALTALQQSKSKRAAVLSLNLRTGLRPFLMDLTDRIGTDTQGVIEALRPLEDGFRQTRALLHGISVALVGPPNSGKSTLFNRLLGRSAAIVNERAGTTRDWITGEIEIYGVTVSIIDTAGLRVSEDYLENIAIAKGNALTAHVDGCILVLDASTTNSQQGAAIDLLPFASMPTVIAMNKCDLESPPTACQSDANNALNRQIHNLGIPSVRCSAVTNEGVDSLVQTLLLTAGIQPAKEHMLSLFTQRQVEAVKRIIDMLPKSPDLAVTAMVDDLIHPFYRV